MRTVVPGVLVALICQYTLISGHALGRPASTADLAQIKSLLQRFEETLTEVGQEDGSESDYEEQESEPNQASRGWTLNTDLFSDSSQPSAEEGRTQSHRSRLQDLLLTARKRSSGCFGARMDRIGNASGLGCNNSKGQTNIASEMKIPSLGIEPQSTRRQATPQTRHQFNNQVNLIPD